MTCNCFRSLHYNNIYSLLRRLHSSSSHGKKLELVVSSLRVDNVASASLGLSRRHIDLAFLSKLLFLNGKVVEKKSIQVKVGDIIDKVRKEESTDDLIKFDNIKILEIGEKTIKGKQRIIILRIKANPLALNEFQHRLVQLKDAESMFTQ